MYSEILIHAFHPQKAPAFAGEMQCYIHSVSPIKRSGPSKYFNCELQTYSNVVKAVCFAIEKKEHLDTLAQHQSPVKLKKYGISNKYGRQDIVINKYTTLTPCTASFPYKSLNNITSIASLSQVTPDQLVSIKGQLLQLSGIKTLVLQSNPVKKQEDYISDPTDFIKLVLWGDHAGTLDQGQTYYFDKIRVKVVHQERYLNTPKNEECQITLQKAFPEPVQLLDIISPVKDINANILGVTNISKYHRCCSCNKKVTINDKLATCSSCSMTMKMACCNIQWSLKLYVQEENKPAYKIRFSVFNEPFNKLMEICHINPSITTDVEILENLLELELVKL